MLGGEPRRGLQPCDEPSRLNPAFDLQLLESAAEHYTLVLMTWVGGIFFRPRIIGCQIWNYYMFRKRVRIHQGGLDKGY